VSEAVVLMAYGSPERIDDVPAYYADIRGGRPIAPEHLEDLVARYRALGIPEGRPAGGGAKEGARGGTMGSPAMNPLNAITEQTRVALERELGFPVFTGMKHWTPRIADAAEGALGAGADTVVGLVLAPHYSRLSIAGYEQQLEDALAGRADLRFVESWHDYPPFIDFLAARVRGTHRHVVFTAHSLPARVLEEGDPYQEQLFETARLVADDAGLEAWSFAYQSESPTGELWLGPDILDHIADLHGRGVTDVLVCPVGFVSDHLEIRWDIDVEAQERARALGMDLERIEMPNADPAFVQVLALLVELELARAPR
jgi:ferrochelatase